jgi:hypothetical protein
MSNEVKRYSFIVIIDNVQYKLFNSTLKDIDLLTTNFINRSALIAYIKEYFKFPKGIFINDVKVVYYIDETAKDVELLFADKRLITDEKKIIESIGRYIGFFSNVSRLNLGTLKEPYLLEKMNFLQSAGREPLSKYNFAVRNICDHLRDNYKVRRDFVLYMITQTRKIIPESTFEPNAEEVNTILGNLNITNDIIQSIVNRVIAREQERMQEHHKYFFPSDYDSDDEYDREERRGMKR